MAKLKQWQVTQRQNLPLDIKIRMTELRIRQWYEYYDGQVFVSYSGGKDSTVLLHLVRSLYPDVPAVFCNTGLEFPEIVAFVKATDNVVQIRPRLTYPQVIKQYGYPVVSKEQSQYIYEARTTGSDYLRSLRLDGNARGQFKISAKWKYLLDAPFKISHYCCMALKKSPFNAYTSATRTYPYLGIMADDSMGRLTGYKALGCNAFNAKRPASRPIMFWLEDDIWAYIERYNLSYSPIYDMGYAYTGCTFCLFGLHMERGETRFERMAKTHPKLHSYCMTKLGLCKVLDWYPERRVPVAI